MENKVRFRRFGTMIDCSRNAVMNVPSVKKWIDITSDLGYNTLLLYTEDTYEVEKNPYFGYLRGKYSKEELKEIDAYAREKGMELIPCIQTLAHLHALVRWPEYKNMVDVNDILLIGEEKVYELIDEMFQTVSECFSSKVVNIGMDEAHMVGRGKFYDLHGEVPKTEILLGHLQRVSEIGKKYGFQLTMWSDMFFRLLSGGTYYENVKFQEGIKEKIPSNVELVYWDYYATDKSRYDTMLQSHSLLGDNIWFAGALWTWTGFAPHNDFSMRVTESAFQSCFENGVSDVVLTLWGDDGGECSRFAVLPSLFAASEYAKGNFSLSQIKEKFEEKYGIPFDAFMLLDLPYGPNGHKQIKNPEKYLLYNDPFMGIFDSTLAGGEIEGFSKCARALSKMKRHPEWGTLFATLHALCSVLSSKADLGQRTRMAYGANNREELNRLVAEYRRLTRKLKVFYSALQKQWYEENKPQGFEVQDVRIGGVILRLEDCRDRLIAYLDGTIDRIEELEEKLLDADGAGERLRQEPMRFNRWHRMVSAGSISHLVI